MSKILMATLFLSLSVFADDLQKTTVEYFSEVTKTDIENAKNLLSKALKLKKGSKQYLKLIKLAKKSCKN